MIQCVASSSSLHAPHSPSLRFTISPGTPSIRICATASSPEISRRRAVSLSTITTAFSLLPYSNYNSSICWSKPAITDFTELDNSGGVKVLDLRIGDGDLPLNGDQVSTPSPLYIMFDLERRKIQINFFPQIYNSLIDCNYIKDACKT